MAHTLLSIIVVSYNTSDLTLQTLSSSLQEISSSKLLKNASEIFVVDNNSKDDSLKKIKNLKKKEKNTPITLISNKENKGFSAANNQALKKASGKYLLLLNSDTKFTQGSLEKLVQRMLSHDETQSTAVLKNTEDVIDKLGILSARLLNPDLTYQSQGGKFPNLLTLFFTMTMLDDLPIIGKYFPSIQHTGLHTASPKQEGLDKMQWVAGTAMLIKSEVLHEIGNLDETIFMYGEDVEFCMRAAHHHWDAAIDHSASVIHYKSQSSSQLSAIRGEFAFLQYLWAKHKPLWQKEIALLILELGAFLKIIAFSILTPDKKKVALYREILSGLLHDA